MTKINVFVIDDDELDRYLATRTLGKFDVFNNVVELADGQDAVEMVSSPDFAEYLDDSVPALVFLDINMPRMNGFDFLDHVSEQDSSLAHDLSDHVVMLLTSSSNEEDRKRADNYDIVKGHIEKPITAEVVSEILENHYAVPTTSELT